MEDRLAFCMGLWLALFSSILLMGCGDEHSTDFMPCYNESANSQTAKCEGYTSSVQTAVSELGDLQKDIFLARVNASSELVRMMSKYWALSPYTVNLSSTKDGCNMDETDLVPDGNCKGASTKNGCQAVCASWVQLAPTFSAVNTELCLWAQDIENVSNWVDIDSAVTRVHQKASLFFDTLDDASDSVDGMKNWCSCENNTKARLTRILSQMKSGAQSLKQYTTESRECLAQCSGATENTRLNHSDPNLKQFLRTPHWNRSRCESKCHDTAKCSAWEHNAWQSNTCLLYEGWPEYMSLVDGENWTTSVCGQGKLNCMLLKERNLHAVLDTLNNALGIKPAADTTDTSQSSSVDFLALPMTQASIWRNTEAALDRPTAKWAGKDAVQPYRGFPSQSSLMAGGAYSLPAAYQILTNTRLTGSNTNKSQIALIRKIFQGSTVTIMVLAALAALALCLSTTRSSRRCGKSQGKAVRVYLSHANADRHKAEELERALKNAWSYPAELKIVRVANIPHAEQWRKCTITEIAQCDAMFAVATKSCLQDSEYGCQAEWQMARMNRSCSFFAWFPNPEEQSEICRDMLHDRRGFDGCKDSASEAASQFIKNSIDARVQPGPPSQEDMEELDKLLVDLEKHTSNSTDQELQKILAVQKKLAIANHTGTDPLLAFNERFFNVDRNHSRCALMKCREQFRDQSRKPEPCGALLIGGLLGLIVITAGILVCLLWKSTNAGSDFVEPVDMRGDVNEANRMQYILAKILADQLNTKDLQLHLDFQNASIHFIGYLATIVGCKDLPTVPLPTSLEDAIFYLRSVNLTHSNLVDKDFSAVFVHAASQQINQLVLELKMETAGFDVDAAWSFQNLTMQVYYNLASAIGSQQISSQRLLH